MKLSALNASCVLTEKKTCGACVNKQSIAGSSCSWRKDWLALEWQKCYWRYNCNYDINIDCPLQYILYEQRLLCKYRTMSFKIFLRQEYELFLLISNLFKIIQVI
ncbi:Hypothetical_protein [Hexamita inflata]|uniref:Hypothetical_protein n=1 Tax=Hexamita inflata TaxID=28002 RepID=A0AA86TTF5_9EUKA|nr:Hypothetical protein HINF_LOCUS15390 [Hexamita inflata]